MLNIEKTYTSNNYGDFVIIDYSGAKNVKVKFVNTGYITTTETIGIERGAVKDKLMPNVYGVGFIGDGNYKPSINRVLTKAYRTWKGMLQRCYSSENLRVSPTYVDCYVCTEWHNFQNFAHWFYESYPCDGLNYELDKDIKIDGNKIYSPSTCLFVSKKANNIKAKAKHYTFINPKGNIINIYNLNEFCKKMNLNHGCMCAVHSGKESQHKRWVKPKECEE